MELNETLGQEETPWMQKSRVQWLSMELNETLCQEETPRMQKSRV